MANAEHELISITEQPIELCKLLKIANLVSGGGEAKIVISEGYVLVNGEVEFRKRKKILAGDIIEFNGDSIEVVLESTEEKLAHKGTEKSIEQNISFTKENKKKKVKHDVSEKIQSNSHPAKRKPISF